MSSTLKEKWRKDLSIRLFELASISLQKASWLGNLPWYRSNYEELLNGFDDLYEYRTAQDFIKEDAYLTQEELNSILHLTNLINKFDKKNDDKWYFDSLKLENLWKSNEWIAISNLSRDIYLKYFKDDERIFLEKDFPEHLEKYFEKLKKYSL